MQCYRVTKLIKNCNCVVGFLFLHAVVQINFSTSDVITAKCWAESMLISWYMDG